MRITSRRGTIVFFLCLGIGLVALAVALNVGWIILNWREGVLLFFGIIFFALIIAGMVVNTIFLVRELRRSEQHDSFINAVTHELKTPVASIRLHLETLQRRDLPEAPSRISTADAERHRPADRYGGAGITCRTCRRQESRAGKSGSRLRPTGSRVHGRHASRHHLQPEALRYEEASSNGSGLRVRGSAEDLVPRCSMCSTTPSNIPAKPSMSA